MTIASEITNYANGLSDAYDAVNDMQGVIPQDKNMNNLDTAIRTIPQNQGPTYTAGNGISIDANNEISIDDTVVAELSDLPTKTSDLQNDGSDGTSTYVEADDLAITLGNYQEKLTAGTNISIDSNTNTISATDTTYSNFTGATSSVAGTSGLVPAPAAGDEGKALHGDGTWKDTTAKLVEMSYGESSAWAKFIAAYNAGSIVYCRASSNSNPATGTQGRKAFMAYVNNATNPTEVEFQYVRSVSSKTSSQPVDQVFVYKLTSASGGTWTVQTRDMAPKVAAGTNANVNYSNGTYTVSATDTTYNVFVGATSSADGAVGLVPAPTTSDTDNFLKGDGTWGTPSSSQNVFTTNEWNALWA